MKAFIYVRVSKEDQARGDRYSLPQQESRLQQYATERGISLVATFQDVQSGRRDDRAQYQAMLSRARLGEADTILVRWLDRCGRRPREILTRIWELQDLGVSVEASDEDLREELILLVRAALTGKESERLSERVRATLPARAAQGKWSGKIAWGMRYDANGKPEPDPDPRFRCVDLAYEWYDPAGPDRLSLHEVVRRLTHQGYLTPTGQRRWSITTVYGILQHVIYCGDLERNGVSIKDNHPARIARDCWERVQTRLRRRRNNRLDPTERVPAVGAGLVYCECGARCHLRYAKKKSKVYRWWYCTDHGTYAECPVGFESLTAPLLERTLAERVCSIRLREDVVIERSTAFRRIWNDRLAGEHRGSAARLSSRLVSLRERERRLLEDRLDRTISREQFTGLMQPLLGEIATVESELASAQRYIADEDGEITKLRVLAGQTARLQGGEYAPGELQTFLASAVDRIILHPNRTITVQWSPAYKLLIATE